MNTTTHQSPRWRPVPRRWTLAIPLCLLALAAVLSTTVRAQDGAVYDLGDASDPTFPTRLNKAENAGPAVLALDSGGAFVSHIILGECVSVEADAKLGGDPGDDCDDGQPTFDRLADDRLRVLIRRTDAPAAGDFFLNVLIDINNDGAWNPDSDWIVQNCPVPAQGEAREVLECLIDPLDFLSIQPGWARVMISDLPAPASGWDGSAFFAPGEARGEIEDYEFFADYDFGDAPDGPYPTYPANTAPSGPFVPRHYSEVGLGSCTTWEWEPYVFVGDFCDDGLPAFDINAQFFAVDVSSSDGWEPRPLFINVVFDLDGQGGWHPQNEWLVRNCDVPTSAQTGSLTRVVCPLAFPVTVFNNLPPDSTLWFRVLLSEESFDEAAGWDGTITPDTLTVGEIEDYAVVTGSGGPPGYGGGGAGAPKGPPGQNVPVGPFVPVGPGAGQTTVPRPGEFVLMTTYEDPPDDAVRCDTGDPYADPEVDIARVTVSQSATYDWVYVDAWLTEPLVSNFSFAVLTLLGNRDEANGYVWEIHDTNTRIGPFDPSTGQLLPDTVPSVMIVHDQDIGLVSFSIPRATLPDVTDTIMVRTFHTPTADTQPQPTACDIWGPLSLETTLYPAVAPAVQPGDEGPPPTGEATTPTPQPVTSCQVTALNNVNLREQPGTTYPVVGTLAAGQSATADGQTLGDDSFTWYHLEVNAYVREDVVTADPTCSLLPLLE